MTKIGFFAPIINERGTSTALYDYAHYHETLHGGQSVILHFPEEPTAFPTALKRFEARFETRAIAGLAQIEAAAREAGCDAIYALKNGMPDALVTTTVPLMVHAVFTAATSAVHGASYAFVSDWLSQYCSGGRVPAVPHICSIGDDPGDMRDELGIPADAFVLGCYGGAKQFNLPFVRDVAIPEMLAKRGDLWLAFMNINPFIDHPRVVFRPGTLDLGVKTAFINSCNAMLHGRRNGESFGLAVAEFALRGKPVLTWAKSRDRNHIVTLGDRALLYRNAKDLVDLVMKMTGNEPSARDVYATRFSPEPVMERFRKTLLEPALVNGPDGARKTLGLRPWHSLRLPLARAGLLR